MSTSRTTAFISGHTDVTPDEFATHYKPLLDSAILHNDFFVMAGAFGADLLCLQYLLDNKVPPENITVYLHDKYIKRKETFEIMGLHVKTGYASHYERDEDMTRNSLYDIAFLRSDEDARKRYGIHWQKDRKSATELNLERRQKLQHENNSN